MIRALRFLALSALLFAVASIAATKIVPTNRVEFTNCAATGSSSQTITGGLSYLFRVSDEDVWVCWAATCGTGGERMGQGFAMVLLFADDTVLSCRSTGGTGDAIFTQVFQ